MVTSFRHFQVLSLHQQYPSFGTVCTCNNLPMLTTHGYYVFVAVMESKTINLTIKYGCSYIITLDPALILQPTLCRQLYVNKQMITSPDPLLIIVNTELYVMSQGRTDTND